MKADQFGTPSEQLRWEARWKTPTEARVQGCQDRCRQCGWYFAPMVMQPGHYCQRLDLATMPNGSCVYWKPEVRS